MGPPRIPRERNSRQVLLAVSAEPHRDRRAAGPSSNADITFCNAYLTSRPSRILRQLRETRDDSGSRSGPSRNSPRRPTSPAAAADRVALRHHQGAAGTVFSMRCCQRRMSAATRRWWGDGSDMASRSVASPSSRSASTARTSAAFPSWAACCIMRSATERWMACSTRWR